MRSYIILGIYSFMIAAFYKWEASLFILMASLFIEMILLFIGTLIVGIKLPYKHEDVGPSGAAYALIACTVFIYPMAYMMGDSYKEFSDPNIHGYLQPIVDYKWQILLLFFSFGIGYFVDFKSLKDQELRKHINNEVYRVCFLLFGVGLLGMACLAGIEEIISMTDYYSPEAPGELSMYNSGNKMIPIIVMISARSIIEIWHILRMKTFIKKST